LAVTLDIGHDAALRRVVVPPPEASFGAGRIVDERRESALGRTTRRLDHDHVGTEVGEELARPRDVMMGELDHPHAVERAHQITPS
jgi:hypothetical protein